MTNEPDTDTVNNRMETYAPWVDPGGGVNNRTFHLPDEVVAQPFLMSMDMRTAKDNPRRGGVWFSLNIGGRLNPTVTEQEIEYILNSVRASLESIAAGTAKARP